MMDTEISMTVWVQIAATLFYGMVWIAPANCQPGFISIDCGGNENFTDGSGISWTTDESYISTGQNYAGIFTSGANRQQGDLRYFADRGRTRDCYVLPTEPEHLYFIRLTFAYGDLPRFLSKPIPATQFDVYVNGMFWFHYSSCPETSTNGYVGYGGVVYSPDKAIRLCLIRDKDDASFISSPELRRLDKGMFSEALPPRNNKQEHRFLQGIRRFNFGPSQSLVRYPDDKIDRIWNPSTFSDSAKQIQNSTEIKSADPAKVPDLPPLAVMQTAITSDDLNYTFEWLHNFTYPVGNLVAMSYFQELDNDDASEKNVRGMNYYINGDLIKSFNSSADVTQITGTVMDIGAKMINISIRRAPWSKLAPIWNAIEYFNLTRHNVTQTAEVDRQSVSNLIMDSQLDITDWDKDSGGDPCIPVPYSWINCTLNGEDSSQHRVTGLYLNGRKTFSRIPNEIFTMNLTYLSLEDNNLMGKVPNFSKLTSIQYLSLQGNKLEGDIEGLRKLIKLEYLNLKNNSLSGTIPDFLIGFPNLRHLFFTGKVPSALTSKKGFEFTYSNNKLSDSSTANVRAIGGGLLGGIIGLVIVTVIVWYFVTKKRRAKARILKEIRNQSDRGKGEVTSFGSLRVFTLEQVSRATKNFSRKIGQGGYGAVYFGNLPKGEEVAAKVGAGNSGQGGPEFQNELELLSRIHHANLVSLVGYCNEEGQEILIYEYVPNGSLRDHLKYRETSNSKAPLSWKTRLNIAINSATGLEYLHFYCNPRIIHRDVKSSNILLNRNWIAKVADFGISKQTLEGTISGVQTALKGTLGYIDPEYFGTQILTTKSDVYSFGVLLLEILSGCAPSPRQFGNGKIVSLVEWARICEEDGNDSEIFDPSMENKFSYQSAKMVLELALETTNPVGRYRPDMQQVLRRLVDAAYLEDEEFRAPSRALGRPRTDDHEIEEDEDSGLMICDYSS